MSSWIKLHRSLLDWEWYDDINARLLLMHLFISVNHEDKLWRGYNIKAGSMVFSWETLSKAVGISVKQCRVAMAKLESSKEVIRYTTNKYQVVTLVEWEKLQETKENKATDKQQSNKKWVF